MKKVDMGAMKDVFVAVMGLASLLYLLNPGAGFIGADASSCTYIFMRLTLSKLHSVHRTDSRQHPFCRKRGRSVGDNGVPRSMPVSAPKEPFTVPEPFH